MSVRVQVGLCAIVKIDVLWQDFLKIVREEAGSRVVETWFKAVAPQSYDALQRTFYLRVPNPFVRAWLSSNHLELCRTHLARLLNEQEVSVVFVDDPPAVTSSIAPLPLASAPQDASAGMQLFHAAKRLEAPMQVDTASVPAVRREVKSRGALIETYHFDSFVSGPSNALALSAAQAAAEHVGRLYNPLFIYGGSGLGKTHLLHAIGNFVRARERRAAILYQPADKFVHDFVSAIRLNKVHEFEARYRDLDVLLVDDMQFISKKEQTQEAFFRIFNMLHQSGKQLVFTADSMPCDIVGLAERMRSRLEGGLIADIQMPSLETKIAILHKKAEANNAVLDDDVAYFIASCECSSIRELEGLLIRVMAFAALTKQPLSAGLARKALAHVQGAKKGGIDYGMVARHVCHHFEYSIRDLRSTKRNKELVHARHVAMYLIKKMTDASLREIGIFFERKDHTTVLSALEKIERELKRDHAFAQELKNIERELLAQ
ncbi:MAG: chromosomal replication initiator protein DnaA [Candidatus Dependentiae bacterium]|nr:chromosomal replication initiator protein DnaA [Candidatus Dependentiae bacterium]